MDVTKSLELANEVYGLLFIWIFEGKRLGNIYESSLPFNIWASKTQEMSALSYQLTNFLITAKEEFYKNILQNSKKGQ